jgi:hypothetical protein
MGSAGAFGADAGSTEGGGLRSTADNVGKAGN